ncbi:hypothetical protein tb265_37850 [Gemmatimonadetes bacterium T265]|nr:hypothetical protein tb265_37850 [Gemmatimonadetes bacterium T265]
MRERTGWNGHEIAHVVPSAAWDLLSEATGYAARAVTDPVTTHARALAALGTTTLHYLA